jgi:hypothetical protein
MQRSGGGAKQAVPARSDSKPVPAPQAPPQGQQKVGV